MNRVLMEQAVNDVGVQPVGLGAARVKVNSDMVNVLLKLPVQRGAESATPCFPLLRVSDYRFSVGTSLAPMSALVVLIKCVGSPEALVTIGTRVLPPSLMKLLQVPLPVELPFERLVA